MNKNKLKKEFSQKEIKHIIDLYITPFDNFSSLAKKFQTSDETIKNILKDNNVKLKSKTEAHSSSNINIELTEKHNLTFDNKKVYFNTKGIPFIFFTWRKKQRRRYLLISKCDNCKKDIITSRNMRNIKHSCSKKCRYNMMRGKNNSNWTGGVKEKASGYLMDYMPNHPHSVQNYVLRHRLVMEKKIGRFLTKDEYIHLIDFNKKNNNIDNLFLCDKKTHLRIHSNIHKILIDLIQKQIITFNKERIKYEIK